MKEKKKRIQRKDGTIRERVHKREINTKTLFKIFVQTLGKN